MRAGAAATGSRGRRRGQHWFPWPPDGARGDGLQSPGSERLVASVQVNDCSLAATLLGDSSSNHRRGWSTGGTISSHTERQKHLDGNRVLIVLEPRCTATIN